ncbi:hypothetical protein HD806DRAFT_546964 [Xylariaceae sp. AK1471]|nr:hypothetical protein HD806DRAFT_546964 [Xylariaceae sp. AK1471]
MSTFCSLCGVLVDMWQGLDDQLSNPHDAQSWLAEVRAIRTTSSMYNPFVTGVGWLNYHGEVIAPTQCDLDHTQSAGLNSPDYRCYAIHDACWKLLIARVDPAASFSPTTVAAHLFAVLYNTPMNGRALVPDHDYGHAASFQDAMVHTYFIRVNATAYWFITGDPKEPFQFDDETLQDACPPQSLPGIPMTSHGELDIFCMLPYEITMLVLTFLPSKDICNLRLASRHLSSYTSPELLSQKFWSSRFDPDMELGFVFARGFCPVPTGRVDWRIFFFRAKEALTSDLFPGFQNRQRIWSILGYWRRPLDLRLANRDFVTESPYKEVPLEIPKDAQIGLETVCSEASFIPGDWELPHAPARKGLTLHGRLFERQSLIIWYPRHPSQECRLRASFISMHGHMYLSGIRYCPSSSEGEGDATWSRAGFVNRVREQEVCFGVQDSLEWLDVVVSPIGILGLRFHMKSPIGSYSRTLGNMEEVTQESGVGRLKPSQDMNCLGLVLGLDACKVISISLVETQGVFSDSQARLQDFPSDMVKSQHLWNPRPPPRPPKWNLPGSSSNQEFILCYNMDFGGVEGRLLRSLTRLVFFMGGFPSVFLGVDFIYADGSVRSFGRRTYRASTETMKTIRCIRQDFPIDGPNGENINKLTTSYSAYGDTIQSITVSTSAGRSQKFCLYGKDSRGNCEELVQVLEAEPHEAFTSFFAMTKSPVRYFRAFSASCSVVRDQPPAQLSKLFSGAIHNQPITDETLVSASHMLDFPRGFAFVAADTAGIKNIRVSVNKDGLSSDGRHITGLMLEYRDSNVPVILGQWIVELDNFYIAPEDRLAELTSWHNFTSHLRRAKFGHIKRLKLGTAKGQTKEFPGNTFGDEVLLHFRETPYATLKSIVWGCNHEWDHFRVLHEPRDVQGSRLLPPVPVGSLDMNLHVRQEVFMEERLENGQQNPAVSIEVSFKDLSSEPSGLTLIYANGEVRTIGTRGRLPCSMPLNLGEKLARMEIGVNRKIKNSDKIRYITLLTNSNRTLEFSERDDKCLLSKDIHHRRIFILDPSSSASQESIEPRSNDVREFPKEANAFVGFWAVPTRRGKALQFNMLGPIFDTRK